MIVEIDICLTKPRKTANSFNNYFFNVPNGIQSLVKYTRKISYDFFSYFKMNFLFINPAGNNKIKDIIESTDPLKSVVPKNIGTQTLKFCKKTLLQTFDGVLNATLQQ